MNHKQILGRCQGARFVGPACLLGFWLVYDGYSAVRRGAVANIVPSREDEVWGGLFEISEENLKILDGFEGYPRYYARALMSVSRPGEKEKIKAWVYFREAQASGVPSKEYLAAVLQGAIDCRLPDDYIRSSIDILPKKPPEHPESQWI